MPLFLKLFVYLLCALVYKISVFKLYFRLPFFSYKKLSESTWKKGRFFLKKANKLRQIYRCLHWIFLAAEVSAHPFWTNKFSVKINHSMILERLCCHRAVLKSFFKYNPISRHIKSTSIWIKPLDVWTSMSNVWIDQL